LSRLELRRPELLAGDPTLANIVPIRPERLAEWIRAPGAPHGHGVLDMSNITREKFTAIKDGQRQPAGTAGGRQITPAVRGHHSPGADRTAPRKTACQKTNDPEEPTD
jgi:hypothetical protein